MRIILTLIISFFTLTTFGQQMTSEQWEEEAKTNIRLLPKYGHVEKTEAQKKSDQEFIETVLKQDSSNRKASDHMISLGFKYLNRDIKTAMYRFNQAYLLDSTNTDIYWGFGGVYMTLGLYSKAENQYKEGLAINPNNTHLLTDYGTNFLAQYYPMQMMPKNDYVKNPKEEAIKLLDSAITYMTKSYQIDMKDQNTTFKLSICYWNKGDCDNAWKYYNICQELGGQPITEDYTNDLKKKCKKNK
jgi:tetratricopeptide (TPR) repeat protein